MLWGGCQKSNFCIAMTAAIVLLQHTSAGTHNKFFIFITVRVLSLVPEFSNVWLHIPCPSAAEPKVFLSTTTFQGVQTSAHAHANEFRSTSVRRRTTGGYAAPTAGSWQTVVSYEPAVDRWALCDAVCVAAVNCLQWHMIKLQCKMLTSTRIF